MEERNIQIPNEYNSGGITRPAWQRKSVWWECFCTGRAQEVFLSLAFVIAKGENLKKGDRREKKLYIYTHIINVFVCVYINTYIYIYIIL